MAYGKIHEQFWSDDRVATLSDRAKLLALYLITGPHRTTIGVSRLPIGYVTADLGWSEASALEAMRELEAIGFLLREQKTGWTLVRKALKWDPPQNANQVVAMVKHATQIPSGAFRTAALQTIWYWLSRLDSDRKVPWLKWLDTLPDGEYPSPDGKRPQTVTQTVTPTVREPIATPNHLSLISEPYPESGSRPESGSLSPPSPARSSRARATDPAGDAGGGNQDQGVRDPGRDPGDATSTEHNAPIPLLDWRAIQRQGAWFEAACKLLLATMPDAEARALIAGALAGRADAKAAIERIWRASGKPATAGRRGTPPRDPEPQTERAEA